ncbi:MAG: nucleotidyltransferase domain-containing protein [Paludibacteraceae bacterium]|nr:nucleotidyltransferase domain-containing protein [Paludibacteraceae bacterium]
MISSEVKQMIPVIQEYFSSQPVSKAYLFGSCSRGEETPKSDVDLLVKYEDSNNLSLLKISSMMCTLSKKLNRKVDMIEDGYLLSFAVPSANRDKILIYERKS